MLLLFVHDHRFFRGPQGRQSYGPFPAAVWDRYLRHFDEMVVLARDGGAAPAGVELTDSSHPLVRFELAPSLACARQLLFPSDAVREKLRRVVGGADAVVARLPSELGLLAVRTARRLGKPYAVEVDGCAWDCYWNHGDATARLYAPLAFGRVRRAVRRAPLALYVTSGWLQSRYPSRGYSSSASNAEIRPLDRAGRRRRARRLEEVAQGRPPELGTVASLSVRYKGIQTAIAAVARLRSEGMALRYSVIGPGSAEPWRAAARSAGVADLVRFDPLRTAGEGVRQWLDGLDIHLQPSFHEGLPRATVEAMSRGVACIGSTCGGIPELLPAGRMHRPGDVAGLADCIRAIASDGARLEEASLEGLAASRQYLPSVLSSARDQVHSRLRRLAEAERRERPAYAAPAGRPGEIRRTFETR